MSNISEAPGMKPMQENKKYLGDIFTQLTRLGYASDKFKKLLDAAQVLQNSLPAQVNTDLYDAIKLILSAATLEAISHINPPNLRGL